MNTKDLLKAIGDIDDKYLIEENEIAEINRIESNKMVSIMKYLNLKYAASAILAIIIISIFVFGINSPNDDIGLFPNDIIGDNDRIIFNKHKIELSGDTAGKWIDADVKSQFEFLNNIDIPEDYELVRQGEIYEPANSEDENYTKLWQYSLIYNLKNENENNSIEIIFTRENKIISCLLPNEDEFQDSIINGKKVKLFKVDHKAEAFFEYYGYKFYIKAHTISENDFVNVIKSIFTFDIDRLEIGKVIDIIDTSENFNVGEAHQAFYEDENYIYYWNYWKNSYMLVKYESGYKETIEKALRYGTITIEDLDNYNITYIKKEK